MAICVKQLKNHDPGVFDFEVGGMKVTDSKLTVVVGYINATSTVAGEKLLKYQ